MSHAEAQGGPGEEATPCPVGRPDAANPGAAARPPPGRAGGGPADLTHILATLGIRYLRLDQVDLAMATIVCAMPLVLPLVYFMMKRLSR